MLQETIREVLRHRLFCLADRIGTDLTGGHLSILCDALIHSASIFVLFFFMAFVHGYLNIFLKV